ncbi:MAG: monoamine oxidase, partial [Paracoccaceae bacterium]
GVKTIDYRPQTYQNYHKGSLRNRNFLRFGYSEVKFHTTTWYGFFEKFVLPKIVDSIKLNTQVSEIEYSVGGVSVGTKDGRRFEADQVLITVPVSVLQQSSIRFTPALPKRILFGLNDVTFGKGFKVFLKFKEKFYPDMLLTGPVTDFLADSWDEKTYYDAAFGKPTQDNILGLFTVAGGALPRAKLSDDALLVDVLKELDQIYDGKVSGLLEGARVQNWSRTPHIRGSYSMEIDADEAPAQFLAPVEGKVHFAGEVLGDRAQATVHGAAFSGINAVERILQS